MEYISIGAVTIALKWIIMAVGFVISYFLLRSRISNHNRSTILDLIFHCLVVGFFIYKLSIILVEPQIVWENPLSLIYFSGGIFGFFLAIVLTSGLFFWWTRKKKIDIHVALRVYFFYSFCSYTIYHLISMAVQPNRYHLFYLLISIAILFGISVNSKNFTWMKNTIILSILLSLTYWGIYNYQIKHVDKTDMHEATNFELKTINGEPIKLSDYKGKKILLNFWATWCPPCKAEIPQLSEFYKENKNVVILTVNLTSSEKSIEDVKKFVNENHLSFPILLDTEGKVENLYKAVTIPTSYFIDRNGEIQQKIVGPMSKETMKKLVSAIK